MPRKAAAMPIGDEHAAESGGVEHRGKADEARANLDPRSFRIDRVCLDTRCARRAGGRQDAIEQGGCDTPPAVPRTDPEASDRPDRKVVDGANRSRVGESRQLAAHADADPADRDTVEIGEEAWWRRTIGDLLAEELLA